MIHTLVLYNAAASYMRFLRYCSIYTILGTGMGTPNVLYQVMWIIPPDSMAAPRVRVTLIAKMRRGRRDEAQLQLSNNTA